MEPNQSPTSRTSRINAVIVFVLAVLFYLFFQFAKQDPTLSPVNPFNRDPYDAIGTFGIQAGMFLGVLSLIRAFRPYRRGAPSAEQTIFLIRAQMAASLAVIITLAGDVVALARHSSLWLGSSAGYELSGLLGGLLLLAVLVEVLVHRSARSKGLPAASSPWKRAAVISLAALAVLVFYPEGLTQNAVIHGALLTVIAGVFLLFIPMLALVMALVPYATSAEEPTAFSWWARYRYQLGMVVLVGMLVGVLVFAREGMVEGVPRNYTKAAHGALVYMGLETVGILIGYVLLRRSLGLFHAQGH